MKDVVVAAYPEALAAHLARVRLEAEGIESWIDDENFSSIYPLYTGTIGGVKLKVREEDANLASQVIQGLDADAKERYEAALSHCPHCDSQNIGPNAMGFARLLLLCLLTCGVYMLGFYKPHRCGDCGHTW